MTPSSGSHPYIETDPPLFRAYVSDFDAVADFFAGNFDSPLGFAQDTQKIECPAPLRLDLSERLIDRNRALGCDPRTVENLRLLARENCFVIVAGQQPGLYTGPLLTIYKALTAVALAKELDGPDRRFVPLFWCASEDHDLEEIHQFSLPVSDGAARLSPAVSSVRAPAFATAVDDVHLGLHRRIRELLPASRFVDDVLDLLQPVPGESLSDWFSRGLLKLLKTTGLAIIDPTWIRDLSTPVFERAVLDHDPIRLQLRRTREQLRSRGFHPVLAENRHLHLFRLIEGRRERIHPEANGFRIGETGAMESRSSLLEGLRRSPDGFSSNVVLRPLVQSSVLPVAGVVAGPSEIAYFAEIRGVFDLLEIPMPRLFPRISLTLATARQQKHLRQFGLSLDRLQQLSSPQPPRTGPIPDALSEPIARLRDGVELCMRELGERVDTLDPGATKSLQKIESQLLQRLGRLDKIVLDIQDRVQGVGRARWQRLQAELLPRGRSQERVYGPLPYLARHGLGLPERILERIDIHDHRHRMFDPDARSTQTSGVSNG